MQVILDLWGYQMTWLEALSFALNLLGVYLNAKENPLTWPVSVLATACFMLLAWHTLLYSDVGLQAFFVLSSFYGWYQWLYGSKTHATLAVSRANISWWLLSALILAVFYPLLGWITDHYTNTDVPYADACPVVLSIVGQLMLTRKILESWYLWMVVDALYVNFFIYKELYLMALLYGLFVGMCFMGLRDWKKSLREQGSVT